MNSSPTAGFLVYEPHFLVKAIYTDFSEVKNGYPEELLSSILSANNQQWYDSNMVASSGLREVKDKKFFDYVRKMDREKTYMELICKFQFEVEGSEMAIVKFLFHLDGKNVVSGAYVLRKIEGRWYKTVTPFTNDLSLLIIRMDAKKLEQILTDSPAGDSYIVELLQQVKDPAGSVSIFKLVEVFKGWYANMEQDKIAHFKDPKSW